MVYPATPSVAGPRTVRRMAALVLGAVALAGCGQKGPLSLPGAVPAAPASTASAPAR